MLKIGLDENYKKESEMKTIKNILVPIDLSNYSYYALDYALDLAEMYVYDANITLLHVLDKPSISMFSGLNLASEENFEDIDITVRKTIKKELEKHNKSKLCKVNISIDVKWGNPYEEIVDFAEGNEIDVIVMSAHTKSGLAHFFLGSVTEKVVRYSQIPVLIVRHEKVKNNLIEQSDVERELHLD